MRKTKKYKPLKHDKWLQLVVLIAITLILAIIGLRLYQLEQRKIVIPPLSLVEQYPDNHRFYARNVSENNTWYHPQLSADDLIEVRRIANLPNPYANEKGCTDKSVLRRFPILLPPRFWENGLEWRRYYEDVDTGCHGTLYVGLPSQAEPNWLYQIDYADKQRDTLALTLSEKSSGKVVYQQKLAIFRMSSPVIDKNEQVVRTGLLPEEYWDELLKVFEPIARNNQNKVQLEREGILRDNWFFSSWDTQPQPKWKKQRIRLTPIPLKPDDSGANIYQVGAGKIDFGSRIMKDVRAWQADDFFAISYLTDSEQLELKLIVFARETLHPINCGAISIPLNKAKIHKTIEEIRIWGEARQYDAFICSQNIRTQILLKNGQSIGPN